MARGATRPRTPRTRRTTDERGDENVSPAVPHRPHAVRPGDGPSPGDAGDPDGRLARVAPIVRRLTRPDPSLAVEALGLTFPSPFGVAAGFDKNAVGVKGLDALGFGHIEVGTVTAIPQDGNPRPRLFRLVRDRAVINRMGFNNLGARAAARRLARLRRGGAVVGANIGKSRVVDVDNATEDYLTSARMLAPVADYLAVNVSSPNTPGLRGLQAAATLRPLLAAVREAAGATPLLVKIAPDLPDEEIAALARLAPRRAWPASSRRTRRSHATAWSQTRRRSMRRAPAVCPARR